MKIDKDSTFAKFVYPLQVPEKTSICGLILHMPLAPFKWVALMLSFVITWSLFAILLILHTLIGRIYTKYSFGKPDVPESPAFKNWCRMGRIPDCSDVVFVPIIPVALIGVTLGYCVITYGEALITSASENIQSLYIGSAFLAVCIVMGIVFRFLTNSGAQAFRVLETWYRSRIKNKVCTVVTFE